MNDAEITTKEELAEILLIYADTHYKVSDDNYQVMYHKMTVSFHMSSQMLEDYMNITADIAFELHRMYREGLLKKELFPADDETERNRYSKTVAAFSPDGFLRSSIYEDSFQLIASLRNINVSSAAYMLIYRPVLCSVVYNLAEGLLRMDDDVQVESIAEYLFRSLMKAHFDNN